VDLVQTAEHRVRAAQLFFGADGLDAAGGEQIEDLP